jgi:hypothetical protein
MHVHVRPRARGFSEEEIIGRAPVGGLLLALGLGRRRLKNSCVDGVPRGVNSYFHRSSVGEPVELYRVGGKLH